MNLTDIGRKLPGKPRKVLSKAYRGYRSKQYLAVQRSGKTVDVPLPDGESIHLYPEGQIPEALFMGRFEHIDIDLVARWLKPGMHVLDIGANVGLYSLLADRLVRPGGRVWSFEPSQETFDRLVKNVALNDASTVTPCRTAVSNSHGGALTLRRDSGLGDGERYLSEVSRPAEGQPVQEGEGDCETVPITSVDVWIDGEAAARDHVDFIKIDVEGAEFSVLQGAMKTLTSNQDVVIMFECTRSGCMRYDHCQEDVIEFLGSLGFGVYCWNPEQRKWDSTVEELVVGGNTQGNLWACRDVTLLASMRSS